MLFLACSTEEEITDQIEPVDERSPIQCVDPFIGTGGHGHTFPGATMPFGMVQLSPDTRLDGWDGCSGYHYSDSVIYGFSHTHLSGTGVSDYGDVLIMPTTGDFVFDNGAENGHMNGYASKFDKATEYARPGHYGVTLQDYDIDVELTATERVGIHKYQFPSADEQNIIIDLDHRDMVLDAGFEFNAKSIVIAGKRISQAWAEEQHVYFYIELSHSPLVEHTRIKGNKLGFRINNPDNEPVLIKVGLSATSIGGAEDNFNAEAPHWDFEQYLTEAEDAWAQQLGKIETYGGTRDQRTIFYTGLYHTMIAPNLFNDVDGSYRGHDGEIHVADHDVYTVFSLWDTFRATHPLYTIIEPERTLDFIKTFLLQYQQGGLLPVWELAGNETFCMIGYHSVSVITDAYVKGIRDFDTDLALEAMINSANQTHHGLEAYNSKGFIGAGDESESVSKTLEYAYDDWCIAVFADSLGRAEVAAEFYRRSKNWLNVFNRESGFMQARMNGGWQGGFRPEEVNFNFTEANSWQYSAFVPHDIDNLIQAHGGNDRFTDWLYELFTTSSETSGRDQADITGLIGQYAHGNEPSHHMAYLFHYACDPTESAYKVRQIMDELYTTQPDGLSGNEDCGQMSAWYVLSAMGFYQVTPGTVDYLIGSPLFDKVVIHQSNGKDFVIDSDRMSNEASVVRMAWMNGNEWHQSYFTHDNIIAGDTLSFEVGHEPIETWWKSNPKSAVNVPHPTAPLILAESMSFVDSLEIRVISYTHPTLISTWPDVPLERIDDSYNVGGDPMFFEVKMMIYETTDLWVALDDGTQGPPVDHPDHITAHFSKIDPNVTIELKSEYANQYAAGGDNALIDGIRGPENYRTGAWQGYQGQDVEAIVDLSEPRVVERVAVGALQDIKSWVWAPKSVTFSFSTDGSEWTAPVSIGCLFPADSYGAMIGDYSYDSNIIARYIKVVAENQGPCPEWHLGAGGASWIFLDEIVIDHQNFLNNPNVKIDIPD